MKILGLQKMTLLDFPGKVACTVFIGGCNLRCPFCHNASLVTGKDEPEPFSQEEILSFLRSRRNILDGVAVTGGEPLLYEETLDFLREIRTLGLAVKLDTNGCFPERLERVVRSGLAEYVAMDIKNAPDAYAETVGCPHLDLNPIRQSVEFLLSCAVDYEFRTTVVAEFHTADRIARLADWICGARRYYLQNFVDSGKLIDENMHGLDHASMEFLLKIVRKKIPGAELRGV